MSLVHFSAPRLSIGYGGIAVLRHGVKYADDIRGLKRKTANRLFCGSRVAL
jgi:hypothetical protein